MQKCLGIYIEENLIKYAKVSKDRDDMKVESFGVRFFQDVREEISKIIEETYSFNTPISINLANEKYLYFDIFALLSKKDIEKTVETEFENYCDEKNYNKDAFETKYALMPNREEKEKVRALDIFVNKIEYTRQVAAFEKYKLSKVMPISIAIPNIARLDKKENQLIVNMEEKTIITSILGNQVYNIETLDVGSQNVLDNINKIENSYAKAYDICKNTTIYTADAEELGEEQPYLQYIMPTLFKIAEKLQDIVKDESVKYQTIYLTGTLANVNNIDLYFQEFFPSIECKILKPKVVDEAVTKINIRDYVEANSAIALATVGLGEGIQELNFKNESTRDKISKFLTIEMPNGERVGSSKLDLSGAFSSAEIWMMRAAASILIFLVIFTAFSKILSKQMVDKEEEIKGLISEQQSEIAKINKNTEELDKKKEKYNQLSADLSSVNKKISDTASRRNAIPNLLNQIMSAIPNKVQLTSIENTTDKTIAINAQSNDYDQLGYFIATIKVKNILKNVVSSSGLKNGGIVTVTIEGELP